MKISTFTTSLDLDLLDLARLSLRHLRIGTSKRKDLSQRGYTPEKNLSQKEKEISVAVNHQYTDASQVPI